MITDEEIKRIAVESGFIRTVISPAWIRFARAIYQLGWQRRGESDAALCENPFMLNHDNVGTARNLADAIRNNTSDK